MTTHMVQVRRVYDAAARGDGNRVLVDRIWPRALTKEKADLDEWCKSVVPSTELRMWYHHDPDWYTEFAWRYRQRLAEPEKAAVLPHLRTLTKGRNWTLLAASTAGRHQQADPGRGDTEWSDRTRQDGPGTAGTQR